MYQDHFGLHVHPFAESTGPEGLIALPSRDAIVRRLRYGLEHGQGPALLFGPPGSGKTRLATLLARDWNGRVVPLSYPALPPAELFTFVTDELAGTHLPALGTSANLQRLRSLLAEAATRGERPLLIVDEAHLIPDPLIFETIRILQNFATNGPPDLSLLFVGAPEVLLAIPPGLVDRLSTRCVVRPLTEAETATYLLGRLAAAGATQPLFDPDQIASLHRAGDGLPRRLNRLADLALLLAYAEGLSRPDSRCVEVATEEAKLGFCAA